MKIKHYLICFIATGIFFGCGETNSSISDSENITILEETQKYKDLDITIIDDPWKLENFDLRSTKVDNRPVFVYYTADGSVNSRYFEDRILSNQVVLTILKNQFTIFEIKSDDRSTYRLIKATGDTVIEPKSEMWKSYQTERYGVFETPFCDIVNFDNESLVSKRMNYSSSSPVSFEQWLHEGLLNFEKKNKQQSQYDDATNDTLEFDEYKVLSNVDFKKALAYSAWDNKPVLLYFTGYNCVGYDKFEFDIWPDSLVYPILRDEFLIVSLFLDDRSVITNLRDYDSVRTYGEYWTNYEIERYGIETQPIFDIINYNNESLVEDIATIRSHGSAELYRAWLEEGLSNFKKSN
ncbi:MAG: hypothetical protein GQ574_19015 [Crocinitomix sp.]|nr:hypothetical protein [Crocinitomix sp.]